MARSTSGAARTVAVNRKARRDYFIDDTFEAGVVLRGSEVKSMRAGQGSISEAYAAERRGELFLINAHIPEYAAANRQNHDPRRAPASCCCTSARSSVSWAPYSDRG